MAFTEVVDLNCEITTAIGGTNRKTGKANPSSLEGYYLGCRTVQDRKKKSGVSNIYIFQTAKGNVGVWGKTDLDRKMTQAAPGVMTKVEFASMRQTPNGEMYTYRVLLDKDRSIEVPDFSQAAYSAAAVVVEAENSFGDYGSTEELEEVEDLEEPLPAQSKAPATPAKAPDARRQAQVKALLEGQKRT